MISPASSSGPAAFAFRPTRQPMLWAAVIYSLGILAGAYAWRPNSWWILAAAVFIAAAAYFLSHRAGFALLIGSLAFFFAGALHIQLRNSGNYLDTSILPFADRQDITLVGHVVRDGHIR